MLTSGFDSQIFTLIVGPEDEEKTFTAHASYLSQSPVFDRMCNGHFEEAHTFKIRLPEDTPKVIEALIEYLYSGNCRNYGTTLSGEDTKTATHQLAELYCVAEKYGLGDLKIWIVNRLAAVTDVKNKAAEFLSVASIICARTSESDEVYRTFFKDQAVKLEMPASMSASDRRSLNECISAGSTLAIDIVDLISSKCHASLKRVEAQLQRKGQIAREQRARHRADMKQGEE